MPQDSLSSAQQAFRRDGVVNLRQALSLQDQRLVQEAYDWKFEHPGSVAQWLYPESGARFLQAGGNSFSVAAFERLLRESSIGDIASDLFESGPVWFVGEQLFFKDGGTSGGPSRRTPWHQDSSYLPFDGRKIAVVWIPLDAIPKESALELVRGSHDGPTYNGSLFDPDDDTKPLYADNALPRLPDIESERHKWQIVSWAAEPGDVLVFHPAVLHGGGGTQPGHRRRSLTLRFVGDDVVRVARPSAKPDSFVAKVDEIRHSRVIDNTGTTHAIYDHLAVGEPLHRAGLPQVRPR